MNKRIAVLVSGRGSNLAALIGAQRDIWNGKVIISCVASSMEGAAAVGLARQASIPVGIFDFNSFDCKRDFEREIGAFIALHKVDLICLAGFMHVLSADFLDSLSCCSIINIHPSLLPSLRGLKPQKRALEVGVKISGCTVHYVDVGVDEGEIIIQGAVPVFDNDDVESLSARILKAEHLCYPVAVEKVLFGKSDIQLCCDPDYYMISY